MCKLKQRRRLGFRLASEAKRAVLSKTLWSVSTKHDSLVAKFTDPKHGNVLKNIDKNIQTVSYAWRGMRECKDPTRRWPIKLIRRGFNTLIWSEPWMIGLEGHLLTLAEGIIIEEGLKVRESMFFQPKDRMKDQVRNLFDDETAEKKYLLFN